MEGATLCVGADGQQDGSEGEGKFYISHNFDGQFLVTMSIAALDIQPCLRHGILLKFYSLEPFKLELSDHRHVF